MGAMMVAGLIGEGIDRYVWFAFTIISAVWVARRKAPLPFAHGAAIGFIAGASATFVQGIYADRLAANNPWIVEQFSTMPEGFDLQFFVLRLVPFIGVGSALLSGLLTLLAHKLMNPDMSAS